MMHICKGCSTLDKKQVQQKTEEEIKEFLSNLYNIWKDNRDIPFGEFVLNPFEEDELYEIPDLEFLKRLEDKYEKIGS